MKPLGLMGGMLAAFVLACALQAQIIHTFAGADYVFEGDGKRATSAPLGEISGIAVDRQGTIYVADPSNRMVVKFTPNGNLTVVAGSGQGGGCAGASPAVCDGDLGLARDAPLGQPRAVAVDNAGNVFIADRELSVIRKVSPDGVITTIAGLGVPSFSGDGGPASQAGLDSPEGLALDAAGNLYVADTANHRVRQIEASGTIRTIAGDGQGAFAGDGGPAARASLWLPLGLTFDRAGNLHIADSGNHRIRKVDLATGAISTVAGNGLTTPPNDGPARLAGIDSPRGVAFDASDNLYFTEGHRVRRMIPSGALQTVAGRFDRQGFTGDGGPASAALVADPWGIAVDSRGTVYFTDGSTSRVRRVSGEVIATVAGNGAYGSSGDGGPASAASFRRPFGLAIDAGGNLYVADQEAQRVRKIDAAGVITTLAGNGAADFAGDGGPAARASFNDPTGVAVDRAGNLYIADSYNDRVRRISPDGLITTVAGGGSTEQTQLVTPRGVALDAAGNLYVADESRVGRVGPNGVIATLATRTGEAGLGALTFDTQGNLYFVDDARIRKITPAGAITTLAGDGRRDYGGDGGPAVTASFSGSDGLVVEPDGALYFTDHSRRVRRVASNGIITTIAGNGEGGLSGDGGPAVNATLEDPAGLARDADGNLYIADSSNQRVRRILAAPPSYTLSHAALTFAAKAGGAPPAPQNFHLLTKFSGPVFQLTLSTADEGVWLGVSQLAGALPATIQVIIDQTGLEPGTYRGAIQVLVPFSSQPQQTVAVTLNVSPSEPARAAVDPATLSLSLISGAAPVLRQVRIANQGAGSFDFTASVTASSATPWLEVTPAGGSAAATAPGVLTVTANPANLAPGTYTARLVILSSAGETVTIPVTATVTAGRQTMLISQTGLTFTAVVGGGPPPPQSLGVLNLGQGEMPWTAGTSTLSGGANWLTASPVSGVSEGRAARIAFAEIGVNHEGLAAGVYYGQVEFRAASADNSPQTVTVVLEVMPAGSDPGPVIRPTGLIFVGRAGGSSPGSQSIRVTNLSARADRFLSGRLSDAPGEAFTSFPAEAVAAPGQPVNISVQANFSRLLPQVYRGTLTLQFDNNAPRPVSLLLVSLDGAPVQEAAPVAQAACVPRRLIPLFTSLSYDFAGTVGWPAPVEVKVVDDCGEPLRAGSVVATFSNGDPPLPLASLQDGRWTGTWLARNAVTSRVTVRVSAGAPGTDLTGSVQVTGNLGEGRDAPLVSPGQVMNSAGLTPDTPQSPGALVSILGTRLADRQAASGGAPLPERLENTQVLIGGRVLPLIEVSPGRIDGQLPFDLAANARHALVVQRGVTISPIEEVTIAAAQPAIFTKDKTGVGQGQIYRVGGDGSQSLAEPGNPAAAGETILIECAGLGAVTPPVAAGSPAPGDPASETVEKVTLRIGGRETPASFAGLAPGKVGVYQVRAVMPAGVEPGDNVSVTLSIAEQTSAPVTMAVK